MNIRLDTTSRFLSQLYTSIVNLRLKLASYYIAPFAYFKLIRISSAFI